MNKLAGIVVFLALLYGGLLLADPNARSYDNHFNVGQRIGLKGILTLAAALVIVTGNIDLSMGSVACFCATISALMLRSSTWTIGIGDFSWTGEVDPTVRLWVTLFVVVSLGMLIGLLNGLWVTYFRVQSFIVTLCGMFVYRGMSRWVASENNVGLESSFKDVKELLRGDVFGVPTYVAILLVLLAIAGVFLHVSVYGRYFFALGSNEKAARYSGISVNYYKILSFVLCSGLTALYAFIWLFEYNTAEPAVTGASDELYAIAAAVLGGFSLRGGDGTVAGVLIGSCIINLLPNLTSMWGISNSQVPVVTGFALLIGATVDELLRRRRATRKA